MVHWDSPLNSPPESAIRPRITMPLTKLNTHKFRLEQSELLISRFYMNILLELFFEISFSFLIENGAHEEEEVPLIDLTLNDDIELPQMNENGSRSIIELSVTPPLDINGNEILITTNTKTMQAIAYNKPEEQNRSIRNLLEKTSPELSKPTNEVTSSFCTEQMNSPILYSNLTKVDRSMHSKKLSKYDTNYNRWMQYLRSYNGYRLFVQQNYSKTRLHRRSKGNKFLIQNTLLKWWNSLNLAEKEQYAEIAELKWCKPLAKPNRTYVNNRNEAL